MGDRSEMLLFEKLAGQAQRKRRVVIDNDAAFAIEDAAAGTGDGDRFDAVGDGALVVELGVLHLQAPEGGNEDDEDDDGNVLKNGDLAGGKTKIVAQGRLFGKARSFEMWIGRR